MWPNKRMTFPLCGPSFSFSPFLLPRSLASCLGFWHCSVEINCYTVRGLPRKSAMSRKPPVWLVRLLLFFIVGCGGSPTVESIGVNWGTQASHPLPPEIVVNMLKANGITKVKLFETESSVLRALANSGIEVMVAIPNDLLLSMTDPAQARLWVQNNVQRYLPIGTDIRYVAVGNEPFLRSYNGTYASATYPALLNVQQALNNANLGDQIKATVPLNLDVLSKTTYPSNAVFRDDIADEMMQIVALLAEHGGPFTVNIYPFLSLKGDPHFPVQYAFFDNEAYPMEDGEYTYYNVFDASYDAVGVALTKAGYGNMSVVVGEVGWPTDGDVNANGGYAKRFNQGLLDHVGGGTPRARGRPVEVYMFSLIDEDEKRVAGVGAYERHWGLYAYDGQPKYTLELQQGSNSRGGSYSTGGDDGGAGAALAGAVGVRYQRRQWCVLNENAADRSALQDSVAYACANADCTALGYGCSCNPYLGAEGNASYAFNAFFQRNDQDPGACYFNGLGRLSSDDPSVSSCRFIIQVAYAASSAAAAPSSSVLSLLLVLLPLPLLRLLSLQ